MSHYSFFAMMSRLKYINRWNLMNNTKEENLSEHSLEVAYIAHALAVIRNKRYNGDINAEKAAMYGMFHDCTEIITGDMPTPIKYASKTMREAYARVEQEAGRQLVNSLPEDMKDEYIDYFIPKEEDSEIWAIVKAADKISALIKCIEEEKMGNNEFSSAQKTIRKSLEGNPLPEIRDFMNDFLPAYSMTLDEQRIGEDNA